jgi:hypothetical protein
MTNVSRIDDKVLKKFNDMFPHEEACFQYILNKKAPPVSMSDMIRIKGTKSYWLKGNTTYSPLQGSLFADTGLPLRKWFYALLVFANYPNTSIRALARLLKISYKTAMRMKKEIKLMLRKGDTFTRLLNRAIETEKSIKYIRGKRV